MCYNRLKKSEMIYIFAQNRIPYDILIPIFFGVGWGERLVILTGYVFTGYLFTVNVFTCRIARLRICS